MAIEHSRPPRHMPQFKGYSSAKHETEQGEKMALTQFLSVASEFLLWRAQAPGAPRAGKSRCIFI